MKNIQTGPFEFVQTKTLKVNGVACARIQMLYGNKLLAERVLPAVTGVSQIIESFADDRADFAAAARANNAPDVVYLVDFETDDAVASIATDSACGMTAGMANDSSKYWLRSANRLQSRPVTLQQFAVLSAQHAAPARAWIAGLLPDEVLTLDAADWRAPTAWEIRHIVGEGSFTGITGAQAAALVGVLPQNFRKYTAADGSSSRQGMSFAMWHWLLHRLEVQSL